MHEVSCVLSDVHGVLRCAEVSCVVFGARYSFEAELSVAELSGVRRES